jgi:hypothetical protein
MSSRNPRVAFNCGTEVFAIERYESRLAVNAEANREDPWPLV